MNTSINDGLLKLGVNLQSMTSAEWRQHLQNIPGAICKHLVQGALVTLGGVVTYVVIEDTTWAFTSIPLALVFVAAAIKYFYFTAATGSVLAASQSVSHLQQHFGDDDCEGWHGWHGIGMEDDLIEDFDQKNDNGF